MPAAPIVPSGARPAFEFRGCHEWLAEPPGYADPAGPLARGARQQRETAARHLRAPSASLFSARGHLIVDTVAYNRDGVMVGLVNKAVALPHFEMDFASRSAVSTRRPLADQLEAFGSFDDVVTGTPI